VRNPAVLTAFSDWWLDSVGRLLVVLNQHPWSILRGYTLDQLANLFAPPLYADPQVLSEMVVVKCRQWKDCLKDRNFNQGFPVDFGWFADEGAAILAARSLGCAMEWSTTDTQHWIRLFQAVRDQKLFPLPPGIQFPPIQELGPVILPPADVHILHCWWKVISIWWERRKDSWQYCEDVFAYRWKPGGAAFTGWLDDATLYGL
jgi:hypothetical protein